MSRRALAAHQIALFILAALAVTAFGAVEPWSRPLLGIGAAMLAVSMVKFDRPRDVPWTLIAPCLIAVALGGLAVCSSADALGPSSLLPRAISVSRAREAIAQIVILILVLWCASSIYRGPEGLRRAANGLLSVAALLTLMALLQLAGGNVMLLGVRSYAWGVPFGPILNYNHAADILLLAIPIAIARSSEPPNTRLDVTEYWARRGVLVFGALFLLAGLVISSSRGASLFLALALAVWAFFRSRGYRRWVSALCTVLLPMIVLYKNSVFSPARASFLDDSSSIRLSMWRGGLSLLLDHPLFGVGPGGVLTAFEPYRPAWLKFVVDRIHSEPLELLLEYGLIGGGVIFLAIFAVLSRFYTGWAQAKDSTRAAVIPLIVGIAAVAVHQLVEFSLRIPAVSFLFTVSCGVVWGALAEPEESSRTKKPPLPWTMALACCAFAFIEGIPTSVAGAYEAIYRYNDGTPRRRETLELGLKMRPDADLHRRYAQSIEEKDDREALIRLLRHSADALALEPGEVRNRRAAGAVLRRLGRARDGAFLDGRG